MSKNNDKGTYKVIMELQRYAERLIMIFLAKFQNTPLLENFYSICKNAESVIGDRIMNVNTRGSVYFEKGRGKNSDAFDFEINAHRTTIKAINNIKLRSNDVVYVLGCGKGRAVCHFARRKVSKVVGVEISEHLKNIAIKNVKTLRGRKADVEIRNEDAALTDVDDGTVFYLFNPFGEKTLRAVLKNVERTLSIRDNPVRFIYVRPLYSEVFKEFSWLKVIKGYSRLSGLKVMIYSSYV